MGGLSDGAESEELSGTDGVGVNTVCRIMIVSSLVLSCVCSFFSCSSRRFRELFVESNPSSVEVSDANGAVVRVGVANSRRDIDSGEGCGRGGVDDNV